MANKSIVIDPGSIVAVTGVVDVVGKGESSLSPPIAWYFGCALDLSDDLMVESSRENQNL